MAGNRQWRWSRLPLLGVLLHGALPAAEPDLLSLPLEELSQLRVEVATGTPKPLATTPAATTLLLPTDFQAIGAQTPDEALVSVPGMHVALYSGLFGSSRYFLRGIASGSNAQTLVLVNGIPMTTMLQSNSVPTLEGSVPIQMVKRIEVIRGPGSAVYGADAFAGVINIITKDAEDMPGTQAGVSVGSFDTYRSHVAHSGKVAGADALVLFGVSSTRGDDGLVSADTQTANDARDGTSASLAPGPLNRQWQRVDAYTSLKWQQVNVHAFWREVWDYGSNQGLGSALDPWGRLAFRRIGSDLSWHREDLRQWDVETRLNFLYTNIRSTEPFRTFPPGAFGSFPEGVQDAFDLFEDSTRATATAVYHGWAQHRLRLGSGLTWNDMYKTEAWTNYQFTTPGAPPSPRPGGMTDVSDTAAVFVPENQRTGEFVFAQDEWDLGRQWELTTGLRYDHFSDFGDATTPRLALVWKTTPALTGKLIYGEAFRAPSFTELYVTSNPFALGNPNLRPERLRSGEVELDFRPDERWSAALHIYEFHIRDFIDFLPLDASGTLVAQNAGRYRGRGVSGELEYRQAVWRVVANASTQQTRNQDSDEALGLAPRWQGYLQLSRVLGPRWQFTTQVELVGPRDRRPGDPQPTLAGYTLLALTLRHQLSARGELFLSGRNLLDDDASELGITPLPSSIPLPGPSVTLGGDFHW